MVPQVGDFVAADHPCSGSSAPGPAAGGPYQLVALGPERTLEQDPAFAFRIMVDIASKVLPRRSTTRPPRFWPSTRFSTCSATLAAATWRGWHKTRPRTAQSAPLPDAGLGRLSFILGGHRGSSLSAGPAFRSRLRGRRSVQVQRQEWRIVAIICELVLKIRLGTAQAALRGAARGITNETTTETKEDCNENIL